MKIVNVIGAKGGVGTSTTAAMIAVSLATTGSTVVVVDRTGTGDVSAIVADGSLTIRVDMPTPTEAETIDYCIVDHPTQTEPSSGTNLLVLTNSFLAAASAARFPAHVHGLIIHADRESQLTVADIHSVLAIPPERTLVIPYASEIARLVDSGTLASRPSRTVTRLQVGRFVREVVDYSENIRVPV
jgi:hypothetical protein